MVQQIINVGTTANDRTGDTWRDAFVKQNANNTELYSFIPDNVVVVNSESEFPDQDASTITLQPDTKYVCTGITTAKSFIVGTGAVVTGAGQSIMGITYTGVGSMFTSTGTWFLWDVQISCPNGLLFSATGTNAFVALHRASVTVCRDLGSFSSGAGLFLNSCSFFSVTNSGIVFVGAVGGLLIDKVQLSSTSTTIKMIDLGSATMPLFRITNSSILAGVGATSISGLASSGNINAGSKAVVSIVNLVQGGQTALSGITSSDIQWFFQQVTGVKNSRNAGDSFLTVLETVTISVLATFVEVSGVNWSSAIQDRFTSTAAGVVTYTGIDDIDIKVSGFATVGKVGGGADEIEVRVAINWVSPDAGLARSGGTTENASATSVPIESLVSISNGDNIRMIVANNDATANIEVSKASIVIVEA